MLDDLDKELDARGHRYARYADDFVILVKTPRAGERVLEGVTQFLKINKNKKIPKKVPQIGQVVIWIARLGGFLHRKSDGYPGITSLWRGWKRLADLQAGWNLAARL